MKNAIKKKIADSRRGIICDTCDHEIKEGESIEIVRFDNDGTRDSKCLHSGACMDSYLAWLNTLKECREEVGDDHEEQCAIKKSLAEHDPMFRKRARE